MSNLILKNVYKYEWNRLLIALIIICFLNLFILTSWTICVYTKCWKLNHGFVQESSQWRIKGVGEDRRLADLFEVWTLVRVVSLINS